MKATSFPIESTEFYVDKQWLAINPNRAKQAETRAPFPFASGTYDVVLRAVGESDGRSEYRVSRNDEEIGSFLCPLSSKAFDEGKQYNVLWEKVEIANGDAISVRSKVGTDGQEFSRGRWASLVFLPVGKGKAALADPQQTVVAATMHPKAQAVGLRFQGVNLPKGASVANAHIQFTVDESKNLDPFAISVSGQADDNAVTFGTNPSNVSSRPRTEASVLWKDIPVWSKVGKAGANQRTPDIKTIVQEIIDRDNWNSGNAMAFILEGSGIRTATSFEKDPATAPKLVLTLDSGEKLEIAVSSGTDDMEERLADGGTIDHPSTDLELGAEENASARQAPAKVAKAKALDLTKHFSDPTKRQPDGDGTVEVSGELRQWHAVTLTLDGPFAHELDKAPNPFTDYRMTVQFTHESGAPSYKVPGYFTGDGDAANSGADSGTKWRAHLSPDKTGNWNYTVMFVKGDGVATNSDAGRKLEAFDGKTGSFKIDETDKVAPDMRAKGRLKYVGEHYLQFAGTGEYFLKCGADAPENIFAYSDFDGTFKIDGQKDNLIKTWQPHVRDWKAGDPTWQDGKGKGLVGAINYLASEGMNAFSFLTMNINGDDRNVFPYTTYNDRLNMDVSRLDQWEIVLSHGAAKGMFLHFKTMETENELLLDRGNLGPERKLYYRELIARFAHHPALNWNLGEEINQATTAQKASWAQYFHDTDPYQNHIVIHNMGNPHYDLLGPKFALTGFSLQTSKQDFSSVHSRTLDYVNRSAAAGKKWAVACDEPGDASHSLVTDGEDPDHRNARVNALWGHFTAGGYGLEWYFGYKHPHSDLTCQDWRSRDLFWDQCRHALEFFKKQQLPLLEMANADHLAKGDAYVFSGKGGPYLVVLKKGGTIGLDLTGASGELKAQWFNPRTGEYADAANVQAGQMARIGPPPSERKKDWVMILK